MPHQIVADDSNLVQIPDIRTQPRLQTRERERDTQAKGSPQKMEIYADSYDRAMADFLTARISKRNSINMQSQTNRQKNRSQEKLPLLDSYADSSIDQRSVERKRAQPFTVKLKAPVTHSRREVFGMTRPDSPGSLESREKFKSKASGRSQANLASQRKS